MRLRLDTVSSCPPFHPHLLVTRSGTLWAAGMHCTAEQAFTSEAMSVCFVTDVATDVVRCDEPGQEFYRTLHVTTNH